MTIKTVSSYCCAVFCALIIILSVATNYWVEFGTKNAKFREGLFEKCDSEGRCDEDPAVVDGETLSGFSTARMVVVGLYIIALLLTLIAFIFVTVYCVTGKYYFPIGRVAICFLGSAIAIAVGLVVYTLVYKDIDEVSKDLRWFQFSWSYGAGWSTFGMYVVTIVLLFADK